MPQILEEVDVCGKISKAIPWVVEIVKKNITFALTVWCKKELYTHEALIISQVHKKIQKIALKIDIVGAYLES